MNTQTPLTQEQEAALRRAIMRVQPEYFHWPREVQEKYRTSLPEEDSFRIRQTVLRSLFQLQVKTKDDMDAVLHEFDDARQLLFNSTMLPLMGIGADCFWLNEYLCGKTLLGFNTLYDYDFDVHWFQEKTRQEEVPGYVPKPYRGTPHYTWARLQIDGAFYYATLSMTAGYIFSRIEKAGDKIIEELIPHRYVNGKQHGKREGKGRIFDKRIDASGAEAQLDELNHRFRCYMSQRLEALQDELDRAAARLVYLIDRSAKGEPHMDFVFTDQMALRSTRLRYFMQDCRAMLGDPDTLNRSVEREQDAAAGFLHESHRDVIENFDPTVVRFRNKRRIVIADGACDDLL